MICARKGAPGAIQIAERFHILRNLVDALGKVFQRHAAVLKEVLAAATQNNDHCSALLLATSAAEKEVLQAPDSCLSSETEQSGKTMRQLRYEEVRLLVEHGMTISDISRKTGLDRKTVRKYTQTENLPDRTARPKRASLLDPFRKYLQERVALGCHNAARLFREIEKVGYKGKATLVRDYVAELEKQISPGQVERERAISSCLLGHSFELARPPSR